MVASQAGRLSKPIELPTLALAFVIYAGWLALTWFSQRLPWPIVMLVGGWLVAWHGSLQHETIHGHPTRWPLVNAALGAIPLALWLPYASYHRDHIAHHATEAVTDPMLDPESRYLADRAGFAGRAHRLAAVVQSPLLGRLLLGPPIAILGFWIAETRRLLRTQSRIVLRDWVPHTAGVALVLAWLHLCGMNPAFYLLLIVYPALALTLLRSFAEHRAADEAGHRVAIVEDRGPLAWLFLHNNLHAAHHRAPGVPWYRLPAFYARNRAEILRDNGGLLYRDYGEVLRRFALRRHDVILHPDHPTPA